MQKSTRTELCFVALNETDHGNENQLIMFLLFVLVPIFSGDNVFNFPVRKAAYQIIDYYHEVLTSYKHVIKNFEQQKDLADPVSQLKIWSQPLANLALFPIIGYKWSAKESTYAWPPSRKAVQFIENGAADEVTKSLSHGVFS